MVATGATTGCSASWNGTGPSLAWVDRASSSSPAWTSRSGPPSASATMRRCGASETSTGRACRGPCCSSGTPGSAGRRRVRYRVLPFLHVLEAVVERRRDLENRADGRVAALIGGQAVDDFGLHR